jgi:hypothetical protein
LISARNEPPGCLFHFLKTGLQAKTITNGLVSRRVGTTSTFYAYDPQGSVAQRVSTDGEVLSSDLYDAYGARLAGNPNSDPYGYNAQWGYYTDKYSGFLLLTYRCYDPATAT